MWDDKTDAACRTLVSLALAEDLAGVGDVTSRAIIPTDWQGRAAFVARSAGVVAGLPAASHVCHAIDAELRFEPLVKDGASVNRGDRLAAAQGNLGNILAAERTALNFLQHLSGVATLTRRYVELVAGTKARILDTRKTLPGWRLLDKYAVRVGGGHNHRLGLHDGILVKDNHLAALAQQKLSLRAWLEAARARGSLRSSFVEIEVDRLDQLAEVFDLRPDMVLLDNMSLDQLRQAVRLRAERAAGVLLEASGGVDLGSVRGIAETGVDRISVGALTHSAPALDIALDYE